MRKILTEAEIRARLPKYMNDIVVEVYSDYDIDGVKYFWTAEPSPEDENQDTVTGISYSLNDLKEDIRKYVRYNMRLGYDY